jgi:hypothetical protein
MAKKSSDGLARIQDESRTPATTWRHWCTLLKMDPLEALGVWKEICHPITLAIGKTPEIPYILQLRSGRLDLDIFEFKEEVAKVLHFTTFIYSLDDDRLTKGKIKTALLKLYRTTSQRVASDRPNDYIERFIADACALVVVAKILKGANITLSGVLNPVINGAASLPQVLQLGLKHLGPGDLSDSIREFFDDPFLNPNAAATASKVVENQEDEEDDDEDEEDDDEDEEDDDEDEEDDDEDSDGDGDDGHDGDEDDVAAIDTVLLKFKTAIHALYEAEDLLGGSVEDDDNEAAAVSPLVKRLKVIAVFNPLRAKIPSMEEAQKIAMRLEHARNVGRHRPSLNALPLPLPLPSGKLKLLLPSKPLPPPAATGGGGGGASAHKSSTGGSGRGGGDVPTAGPLPTPRSDGKGSDRVDMNKVEGVTVEPTDFVDVADVTFGEFSERLNQVCTGLANVESADQIVWSLFVDPAGAIGDVPGLARALTRENTPTFKAYTTIRMAAKFMGLKNLLNISDQALNMERNFAVEANQLFNYVKNSNDEIQRDTRQVSSLGKVLDHAASALVRLEALRVNVEFAETHGEQYTREAVTVYFEETLRQVTDETDRDILNPARERADADTVTMLASHEAQEFVESILITSRAFAMELVAEGHVASDDKLQAALGTAPLTFEGAEPTQAGDVPVELLKPSDLGAIYDDTAKHVCVQAWAVLAEVHQPEKIVHQILDMLREVLLACLRFKPEKRRHQDDARFALSVVSLDKVSGNANLKDLYVRVSADGQMDYVDDYEDGTFVDLFELREYKPARLASAAKKEAEAKDTQALQTGRKYLCTVGRTNRLFGDAPADVINGCVRDDEGVTTVFPAF